MEQTQTDNYLKMLSLHRIREVYIKEAENAANAKLSYQEYLHRLVEQQVLSKIERSINRKTQLAGFPQIKRLEEFDFSFQPKINEKLIRELATLEFMNDSKNVLFIGAPGVGKTHLAISIGIKATQARKRVLFYTAEHLTQELAAAEVSGGLAKMFDLMARIDLLIIDEYTRECLAIRVRRTIKANDVIDTLSDLFITRGTPRFICSDNGPEFVAELLRSWLFNLGVTTAFIEPVCRQAGLGVHGKTVTSSHSTGSSGMNFSIEKSLIQFWKRRWLLKSGGNNTTQLDPTAHSATGPRLRKLSIRFSLPMPDRNTNLSLAHQSGAGQ